MEKLTRGPTIGKSNYNGALEFAYLTSCPRKIVAAVLRALNPIKYIRDNDFNIKIIQNLIKFIINSF
jgi:hypothetical protein